MGKLVPPDLPHGTLPEPTQFDDIVEGNQVSKQVDFDIDVEAESWHKAARLEWRSLIGELPDFKAATFKWAPAVGPKADSSASPIFAAATWRALAQRMEECATVVERHVPDAVKMISRHIDKAR